MSNEGVIQVFFGGGILVAIIARAIYRDRSEIKDKKMFEDVIEQFFLELPSAQKIIGCNFKTGLAIDEENKTICVIENQDYKLSNQILSYKNLLSVKLFEDGETVTSAVRSSQIGSVLIGGLALGGIGAVIGGLSRKTKSSEIVEKIILRLVVNDTKHPFHEVYFLNSKIGIKKKDSRYQEAMQQACHWHSLIEVLIKRADMEDKENTANNVVQISQSSIADELKKLAELCNAGILSDVEFQQQKEKLLG